MSSFTTSNNQALLGQACRNGECHVVFLRGAAGSGKTTWTEGMQELLGRENCVVVSADRYFHRDIHGTNPGKEYRFDHTKLADAHKWAKDQMAFLANTFVGNGKLIIIDNTCLTPFDVDSYLEVLAECGIDRSTILVCNFRVPTLDSEAVIIEKCVDLLQASSGAKLLEWASMNLNQEHQAQVETVLEKNQQLFRCIPAFFEFLWEEERESYPQLESFLCQNQHSVPQAVVLRMLAQSYNPSLTTNMESRFDTWLEEVGWRNM